METAEAKRQCNRDYYLRNKEKIKVSSDERYRRNKDKLLAQQKQRYREKVASGWKQVYTKKARARHKERYEATKHVPNPRKKQTQKEWCQRNRERRNEQSKLRQRQPSCRAKINARNRQRYRSDPAYRLERTLRSRLTQALRDKRVFKWNTAFEMLGCSIDELVVHLQSLWSERMSWDNYSKKGWHIDHIRPCASFDLANPEEQRKCFHYTNLQPLWAVDNLSKGDSLTLPVTVDTGSATSCGVQP